MDVNGCHITHDLDDTADEGFAMTVTRYIGVRFLTDLPHPWPDDLESKKVSRGPFKSIKVSVDYATSWNDAETPPPMPVVEPPKKDEDPPKNDDSAKSDNASTGQEKSQSESDVKPVAAEVPVDVETASESIAVQVASPPDNPPIVEETK